MLDRAYVLSQKTTVEGWEVRKDLRMLWHICIPLRSLWMAFKLVVRRYTPPCRREKI